MSGSIAPSVPDSRLANSGADVGSAPFRHNHSHEESYARAERDLAMKDPGQSTLCLCASVPMKALTRGGACEHRLHARALRSAAGC
eukprot:1795635-Rhodomonas_salina.2